MIVSYKELCWFTDLMMPGKTKPVVEGVRSLDDVNASSIDVRLGAKFLVEMPGDHMLNLGDRTPMNTMEYNLRGSLDCVVLPPGHFVLAHTVEVFNLPLDISAEFRLKSSAARMGLSHALAVWCDPGWHGSTLTLELHNISRFHTVVLRPGDKIGQMVFHRHRPVPGHASYAARGAYNNDTAASGAKPPKSFEDAAAEILNREFNTKKE